MAGWFLPAAIFGATALAAHKAGSSKRGKMTPKREMILKNALDANFSAEQYDSLAENFAKEGLRAEATLLRKRAALKRLPNAIKIRRAEIAKGVYASKDPEYVMHMADAFEKEGAVGTAGAMRKYGQGLIDAGLQKPAQSAAPIPVSPKTTNVVPIKPAKDEVITDEMIAKAVAEEEAAKVSEGTKS